MADVRKLARIASMKARGARVNVRRRMLFNFAFITRKTRTMPPTIASGVAGSLKRSRWLACVSTSLRLRVFVRSRHRCTPGPTYAVCPKIFKTHTYFLFNFQIKLKIIIFILINFIQNVFLHPWIGMSCVKVFKF